MSAISAEMSALLQGKSAAVACSPEKSAKILLGLKEMGASVTRLPVIEIRETEDKDALDAALSRLDLYAWILFTSSYAVRFFARRAAECGRLAELSRHRNICAVGPATAAALRERGIETSLLPQDFVAEGVLHAFADRPGGLRDLAGARILFPRAREARDVLPRELERAGAQVEIVTCYEAIQGEIDPDTLQAMRANAPDLIVFTSSSTVHNFMGILGTSEGTGFLAKAVVAALGPITASAVQSYGRATDIVPRENTVLALLEALRDFFTRVANEPGR